MRKQLLLCILLCVSTFVSAQKTRVIDNPESDYTSIHMQIKRIEITPEYTIVDIRVRHSPNYWVQIDSLTTVFKESNGDRTFKLLKSDGYELNKQVFMPESGYKDAKFYFEPISTDVNEVDLIEEGGSAESSCFNIKLTTSERSKIKNFLGNWITNDGSNQWKIGITKSKVLYKNNIWTYSVIKIKANSCTLEIARDTIQETIYLKRDKNGNIILKESKNGAEIECSKEFTFIPKETDWKFNQNSYDNEIFKSGKAVIRGYIDNYSPKLKETLSKFIVYNHEIRHEEVSLAEINDDGTFELEIERNYPITMFVSFPLSNIYIQPSDTLLVYFDLGAYNLNRMMYGEIGDASLFMGSKKSADVNNFRYKAKRGIFKLPNYMVKRARNSKIKSSKDPVKEVLAYRDDIVAQIDKIISDSPQLLQELQVDDYVKDQLVLDNVSSLFIDLLELYSDYKSTHSIQTQDNDGKWTTTENKSYKDITFEEYHNFISKYNDNILNNILNLCSSNTWVLFNRYEFTKLFPRYYNVESTINAAINKEITLNLLGTEKYKQFPSSLKKVLMAAASNGYFLSDSVAQQCSLYREAEKELYSLFKANKVDLTSKEFYHYADSVSIALGAGNNFMYQTSVLRGIASDIKNINQYTEEGFIDQLTENITSALPLITNAFLRKQLLAIYRGAVVKCDLKVEVKPVVNDKAEAILKKIIEPYRGNVIFMDFWGTSCGPCRAGMIEAKSLVEELKSHKIKFLYVSSISDSPEAVTNKFLKDKNIKGENIRLTNDEWNYLSQKFGIIAIPHCVLIDKEGSVVEGKTYLNKEKLLELEQK